VRLMLAAKRAEFVELQPFGHSFLVLGLAVVLSLALSALQCNDFAHPFAPFQSLRIQNPRKAESKKKERGAAPPPSSLTS
jgi:hypothetical protein